MSAEKLPPHDLGAERAVLGGLLRWPAVIDDVVTACRREDFYADAHQKVFAAVVSLWDANRPIDLASVGAELRRLGHVEDVGGYAYLAELWDEEPTGANAAYHARAVHELGTKRGLLHAANETARDVRDNVGPAEELLAEAERRVLALSEIGLSGTALPLREAVERAYDRYDARKGTGTSGVPTGLLDLDRLTSGLQDSELTVLAARPSVGKTALAVQVLRHAAGLGAPCFFVSLEMSRDEIADRLICAEARVNAHHFRQGLLPREQLAAVQAAHAALCGLPVHLDDRPGQSMVRVAANARRLRRRHGVRLVVLDYLQLVEPENRKDPRHEQVSAVSRRLKALAKELSCPVLAVAQLNRASEEHDEPELHHLRESGGIEADADLVLLLHRLRDEPGLVGLKVAKNRNGPTGRVRLLFRREQMRFENYADDIPFDAAWPRRKTEEEL